jgi:uncharacterized protein with HEPN domain
VTSTIGGSVLGAGVSLQEFLSQEHAITRDAVERELEVIGEAANRVSESFRQAHPEIPWRDLIGLRNVIVHLYDKVDYRRIHGIVVGRIPALIGLIEPLIPPVPADPQH